MGDGMDWLKNVKFELSSIIALSWSAFAMFYILMITMTEVPESNVRYVDTIIGFLLGTIVATIINYFFGSSKGSKDKDAVMAAIADNGTVTKQ